MPPMRSASFVFCTLLLPASLGAQPPQRDPQAVLIAQRALAAMGSAGGAPDFETIAQGTVTLLGTEGSVQGTFVLKTGRLGQLRGDYVIGGQPSAVVYNGGRGVQQGANGKVEQVPLGMAVYKRADHFPVLSMLAEFADPSVGVRLLGVETINGAPAWRLELKRPLSPQEDPTGYYGPLARCEAFVDQASGLVSKLRYNVPAARNLADQYPMELLYTDYRREGGFVVPHTITQFVAGHQIAVYQITSFSVSPGLNDTDFQLPR